jgi:hypothetical protein
MTDANNNNLILDLKILIDEKNAADLGEHRRIEAQIDAKKAELMKEITKFKLEDNDNITSQLEKGIEGMDVSKFEDPKDKEEAEKVKRLLEELVAEKKKLEEISNKQRGGAAGDTVSPPDVQIDKTILLKEITTNIQGINSELESMKENRQKYMKQQDNTWTWRDDPLFMYYYYTSMGNALGDILNYQIEFWSNLKLSVGNSLGDLSNIEGFFGGIVDKVGNGIENGLTEAAIASQEVITGFLSGGVEVLGVVFSAGADIIGSIWNTGGDILGALGSVVGALGELASDL